MKTNNFIAALRQAQVGTVQVMQHANLFQQFFDLAGLGTN
jgi:hypothetical protein